MTDILYLMKTSSFPITFFLCALMFIQTACSDGEITIANIDFNEVALESCSSTTATQLFFKIKDNESMALQIPSGLLKSLVSETTIESTFPSAASLTYRIFQDNIAADYFCSTIPILSPNVVKNASATSGSVLISTTLSEDGNSFEHRIQLSAVTFIDDQGKRITDLNISDFGVFVTPK